MRNTVTIDSIKEADVAKLIGLFEDGKEYGICLYVDGGFRPTTEGARAGFGVHGYIYENTLPKRGHGLKGHLNTVEGYKDSTAVSKDAGVKVLTYLDVSGSVHVQTNNVGELEAYIYGLRLLKCLDFHKSLKHIRVYSDSKYVIDSLTQGWADGWKDNGWKNSTGKQAANQEHWEEIFELRDYFAEDWDKIILTWVKGHFDFGNIRADYNATLAIFAGEGVKETTSVPEGYWETEYNQEKLLLESKMYYCPGYKPQMDENSDESTYLLFNPPSKMRDSQIGKRVSDVVGAVVRLNKPNRILDRVIQRCDDFAKKSYDVPMVVQLDTVLKKTNQLEILAGLIDRYVVSPSAPELRSISGETLIKVLKKPGLAYRLLDEFEVLLGVIESYEAEDEKVIRNEVDDVFYEKQIDKKGNVTLKMILPVEDSFTRTVKYWSKDGVKEADVKITIALDTPARRMFNAIAKQNPKISILTWFECDTIFRYGLLIETDEGLGLWAGIYSNSHIVSL